ncbi:MAG: arylsulfatase [Planctomycetes bacterium]|nr:arylsulfatase [Planctomycetota bacterium]
MNRREFLKSVALGLTAAVVPGSSNVWAADAPQKPNVVYIIADDLGWNDVGYHGSEIRTLHIDQLAQEGVILDRFYVCPVCSPTRAGILTGQYPIRFGMHSGVINPMQRHGLPPQEFTLPEMLAEAGYEKRIMIGKWHLGLASTLFHPLRHGFTDFYGHYNGAIDYFSHKRHGELDWHRDYASCYEEGYSTDLIGQEAVRWIQHSKSESPFFLYVNFNAPHSPLQAKPEDLEAYGFDPDKEQSPHTDASLAKSEGDPEYGKKGRGNTVRQTYAAMTAAMDRQIGNILNAIDRKGFRENTLIIFHSDNGGTPKHGGSNTPLRGNKFTTWEGGVRVAAMMRWPAQLKGGRRVDHVMGYIDMWPTLAAAVGYAGPHPKKLDGINMLPVLKGEKQPSDRYFQLGQGSLVTQNWKLVRNRLFAIATDPCETTDVAAQNPQIVAALKARVAEFEKLEGPACTTSLPKPEHWPPPEWNIPEEQALDSAT